MWNRRAILWLGAVSVTLPLLPHGSHPNGSQLKTPTLNAVAASVWSSRSKPVRAMLAKRILPSLPDPLALMRRKESECEGICAASGMDLRSAYLEVNASDFRAGRVFSISGLLLSEMDVAVLLAGRA